MNISSSNVSRLPRHVKSVAATLAVAVLAASSWLVLRADVPQVATGTWAPAGEVGAIPNGAASVALTVVSPCRARRFVSSTWPLW